MRGIDLIIDRVEALRVRLDSAIQADATTPTLEHWSYLCVEAKTEAVKVKHSYDRVVDWLALRATDPPIEPSPEDIADAVEICVKRCQELEQKVIDLEDRATTKFQRSSTPDQNLGLIVPPGHIAVVRDKDGSLREVRGPRPFEIDPDAIYRAILGSLKNLALAKNLVNADVLKESIVDEMARNSAQVVVSMLEAQLE